MAAPCYESQAKEKIKVPPAVAKAFANEVLEHIKGSKPEVPPLFDENDPQSKINWENWDAGKPGGLNYGEALEAVSEKTGLQVGTINSILRRDPQVFSRTKQALAKASDMRMIKDAAEAFAGDLKSNAKVYEPGNIAKAWDLQRKLALGGHSVVFPWTHMRNWAVQLPTEAGRARMNAFWRAATDVWRYKGEKGQALYEMDVGLMKASDHYDFFKSAGADIEPGRRTPGDILLKSRKPSWGQRNFDSLKIARFNALEDIWSRADPALKGDAPVRLPDESDAAYARRFADSTGAGKDFASLISRDVNYATGSVTRPPPGSAAAGSTSRLAAEASGWTGEHNVLLSSKLFFAKYMDAMTPLRYLGRAGKMTMAERASANIALKRWANTVGTHLSILGANYAFAKAMGWETPNLTDPTKPDFMRAKVNGVVVPFSPLLEALRLPIVMTASMVAGNQGDAGSRVWKAVMNSAHPTLRTALEQASGRDWQGRPITWSLRHALATAFPITAPHFTAAKAAEPVGGLEYLSTKLPIAAAGGLNEFYQSLRAEGIDASMALAFVKGAIATASSAITGVHAYEPQPKPEPAHHYKNMADKIRAEKSAATRKQKAERQRTEGWPESP